MVFERGFATQTLSQRPKVKPLRSKGFTFGLLKFASLTRTDVNLIIHRKSLKSVQVNLVNQKAKALLSKAFAF